MAQLAAMSGIPRALATFGVPAEPLLAKVGLTTRDLSVTDGWVEASTADELFGLCVEATGCSHFGLLAGALGVGLRGAGYIGYAAGNAPTVGMALQELDDRRSLCDPLGQFSCVVHGREAVFSCALQEDGLRHADQIYDATLALMRQAMRDLCGPTWLPTLVYLPRRRPSDLRPYRDALGPQLKFDALRAGLVFPAEQLALPVVGADPEQRRHALDSARRLAAKREPALFADVRRAIRASLEDHHCSRTEIARRLGMHERTFSRQLRLHGTTFQEMLESTRLTIARELLQISRAPIGKIALSIGYRDSTAFGRAFRRRLHVSPREFRTAARRNAATAAAAAAAAKAAAATAAAARSGDVACEPAA